MNDPKLKGLSRLSQAAAKRHVEEFKKWKASKSKPSEVTPNGADNGRPADGSEAKG